MLQYPNQIPRNLILFKSVVSQLRQLTANTLILKTDNNFTGTFQHNLHVLPRQ